MPCRTDALRSHFDRCGASWAPQCTAVPTRQSNATRCSADGLVASEPNGISEYNSAACSVQHATLGATYNYNARCNIQRSVQHTTSDGLFAGRKDLRGTGELWARPPEREHAALSKTTQADNVKPTTDRVRAAGSRLRRAQRASEEQVPRARLFAFAEHGRPFLDQLQHATCNMQHATTPARRGCALGVDRQRSGQGASAGSGE